MAEKEPRKWSRKLRKAETTVEPRRLSYSDRIFDPYDPDHQDPEMRMGLVQLSNYDEEVQYQKKNRNTGHSLFMRPGELNYQGTPGVYGSRRGILIGPGALSRRSKNVVCVNCGKNVKPSKTVEVQTDVAPYFGRKCNTNCASWNQEGNPFGARIRRN